MVNVFLATYTTIGVVKQCVISAAADFYESGMQALAHYWQKYIDNGDVCVEKYCFTVEDLLYQIVLLFSFNL